MNKRLKRIVRKAFRGQKDESGIAARAILFSALQGKAEDGKVAMYIWQMDCDCASWSYHEIVPASVQFIEGYLDEIYANAEGRVSWHLVKPSEVPAKEAPSRDHALEAYEDGHPHVVYL